MSTAATYPIYTGTGAYDFAHPVLDDLTIEEVATSLSRLYRWRGAIPVTVAHHSVIMARCASNHEVARWCLIHDATEILLGDAPSPLKALSAMEPFRRAEARILAALVTRFGLAPEPAELRKLDLRARRLEVEEYLPHALDTVRWLRPLDATYVPAWSPARGRREFLQEAKRLGIA